MHRQIAAYSWNSSGIPWKVASVHWRIVLCIGCLKMSEGIILCRRLFALARVCVNARRTERASEPFAQRGEKRESSCHTEPNPSTVATVDNGLGMAEKHSTCFHLKDITRIPYLCCRSALLPIAPPFMSPAPSNSRTSPHSHCWVLAHCFHDGRAAQLHS